MQTKCIKYYILS